jgi:hypothetical protein
VFSFAQTHPFDERQNQNMPATSDEKHKLYVRYAEHCLQMVPFAADQEYRIIQREMAAEWLKLADAVLHPLKRAG